MCCKSLETGGAKCSNVVGSSEHTFAEVLTKLFQKEKLALPLTEKAMLKQILCEDCQSLVEEVFQLQFNLREKKNKLLGIFTNSHKDELVNNDTNRKGMKRKSIEKIAKPRNKKEKSAKDKGGETFIIELLKERKGDKFLVKWESYPEEYDSWEPRSSLPEYIVKVSKISLIHFSFN